MWKCSKCGEDIEDAFGGCWSCGTNKDGSPAENQSEYNATRTELQTRGIPIRSWPATGVLYWAGSSVLAIFPIVKHVHSDVLALLPIAVVVAISALWYSESKRRCRKRNLFSRMAGYFLFWIGAFSLSYFSACIAFYLDPERDANFTLKLPPAGILAAITLASICAVGTAYVCVFDDNFGRKTSAQRQRAGATDFPLLRLATGRRVLAREIYIGRTYAGLLEGVPTDGLNQAILDGLPQKMRRIFQEAPVYILPPEIDRPPEPHPMGGARQIALMPPVEIAIRFISFDPLTPDGQSSQLLVIWHQHTTMPLIADSARIRLEHLPWDDAAKDFCY